MIDYIEETNSGIYRITTRGEVFTQTKYKMPIVQKGMVFSGKFKEILKQERPMKLVVNNRGYLSVVIRQKTHMVHRLVATAFIQNPEGKTQVNHIDGNKLNNNVSNLEWCTPQENIQHAFDTGLNKAGIGVRQTYKSAETKKAALANLKDKSKLTEDEVRYVRRVFKPRDEHYSATALAKQFDTSVTAMCKIVKGITYNHVK